MLQRTTACALPTCFRGEGRAAGEPDAALATSGINLTRALWNERDPASVNAQEHRGSSPRSLRCAWTPAAAPCHTALVTPPLTGAAPPPRLARTGARQPCSHLCA